MPKKPVKPILKESLTRRRIMGKAPLGGLEESLSRRRIVGKISKPKTPDWMKGGTKM
jgi:hypothetical protein